MQKIINFDDVRKQNVKEHNPNWPQITIVGSGSGKKIHYLI